MLKNDVVVLSREKLLSNPVSIEINTNMVDDSNYYIIKKDGTKEKFNIDKVVKAINKSAERVMISFTDIEMTNFCGNVMNKVHKLMQDKKTNSLEVADMHRIVESSLDSLNIKVASSYKDYRNYKTSFVSMLDAVFKDAQKIMYLGDNENSNTDSALVSTKRSLIFNVLNKELYKKFFLTTDELQAAKEGYFYIHDMSARRDTLNCCLCDIKSILKGGFELGNQWYTEPKTLDVAFDVMGDIILSAASQQYGGFTIPQVDEVLKKYAEMSYNKYFTEIYDTLTKDYEYYCEINEEIKSSKLKIKERNFEIAHEKAMKKVERDFEQGFQGWEYKFNTVASSRGDYPFITMTFGLGTSELERLSNKVMLRVRAGGQGKPGNKRAVLFPKLVFLYDSKIHGEMGVCRDVYEEGIRCSSKALYPDWLSLEPGSYVGDIYQKYGRVVSPMGCRAFLSPWFERGGMEPADENDKPVYIGRNNLGAISLNLPMILAKARQESKDFYEVLDHYLEMIRRLHKRTYDYLGEMKASINPLMFCQGGFYGGHLGLNDKIRPLLKTSTMSFGFTALNELQQLYNGKSLVEDGQFAIDVMAHINAKINEFKQEDKILYAIYGTPAESLCMSGDTEVQCYNGNKQIKDIEIGDLVYSYNEELKKVELKKVVNSFRSKVNAEVVKVTFDNGQEIICTPEHPFGIRCMNQNELGEFISEEVRYYKASELKPGMRVKSNYIKLNASGRLISSNSKVDDNFYADSYLEYIPKDEAISLNHKVVSVEKMTTKIDVYDIEVEDNHNFYVGGDEGILVHNCGTQVKQFRAKYGIIQNVSDRDYFSNSFHCHVSEDITPTQKQDLEKRFWNLSNGGKIQYVRYRSEKNLAAISTLVDRAMKFGFYEGINMDKDYCEDCGHNGIDFEDEICPVCKSDNVVILNRVCGYLGYSKVHGKSRMNDSKMAEVKDRISM